MVLLAATMLASQLENWVILTVMESTITSLELLSLLPKLELPILSSERVAYLQLIFP